MNRDTLVSKNVSRNRLAPGVPFSPLQSSLVCLFSLPPLPFYSPPRPREGRVQGVVGSGRKKRNTVSYILSSNEAPPPLQGNNKHNTLPTVTEGKVFHGRKLCLLFPFLCWRGLIKNDVFIFNHSSLHYYYALPYTRHSRKRLYDYRIDVLRRKGGGCKVIIIIKVRLIETSPLPTQFLQRIST